MHTNTAGSTPVDATPDSAERKFAEWFRAATRTDVPRDLHLVVAGKHLQLKPTEPLPTEPFTVRLLEGPAPLGMDGIPLLAALARFEGGYLPPNNADAWAAAFARHPNITVVNAYRTDLTSEGVAALAALAKIQLVNLHDCHTIDARAIVALAKLPALTQVNLDGHMLKEGKYTLADVQRLQDAMPAGKITQDSGQPIPGLITKTRTSG